MPTTYDDVYLGNPLLKKANVKQEFTKEQGDYIVAQLIKIEASAGQMYTGKL